MFGQKKQAWIGQSVKLPVRFIAGNDAYTGSIMTFPEKSVVSF
jgi:hypothetical protein